MSDLFRDPGAGRSTISGSAPAPTRSNRPGHDGAEPVLVAERPDWVVVVGVNSTLACVLVAAKLREALGSRIAHVEAGLRSHDWRMPEEVNRVLTDRLADLLLTPSRDALPNLLAEGVRPCTTPRPLPTFGGVTPRWAERGSTVPRRVCGVWSCGRSS
jgi:UDP-N-acetylglucosamine 2-epimerase (non-hydrolysing)